MIKEPTLEQTWAIRVEAFRDVQKELELIERRFLEVGNLSAAYGAGVCLASVKGRADGGESFLERWRAA